MLQQRTGVPTLCTAQNRVPINQNIAICPSLETKKWVVLTCLSPFRQFRLNAEVGQGRNDPTMNRTIVLKVLVFQAVRNGTDEALGQLVMVNDRSPPSGPAH